VRAEENVNQLAVGIHGTPVDISATADGHPMADEPPRD
jgi:hypothetical protein